MNTAEASMWPQPLPDPDSARFWDAARSGRLSVARCSSCGRWQHPPAEQCRWCAGALAFERISGVGALHSWIVVNRKSVPGPEVPYLIGVVELEEQVGLRLSGLLLCDDPGSLRIDMPVRVKLQRVPGGDFAAPVIVA